MSEEQAAQAEETLLEQPQEQVAENQTEAEQAAPEKTPEEVAFQKRINREVAKQHAQKRRADDAERRLSELESSKGSQETATPKIEDFDHDEDKYREALIKHEVNQAVSLNTEQQSQAQRTAQAKTDQDSFNERIDKLGRDDFDQLAGSIPELPPGVVGEISLLENGPEIVIHLAENLDVADKLAGMSPGRALMELGQISASIKSKPAVKLSNAPTPITPISSGGSLNKDVGEMSMEEIYAM